MRIKDVVQGTMMVAAAMGATAFQKGLGAMHAMAHPVGALYGTHHGMTNAVVMPYVLLANRPAIEPVMAQLAAYTGIGHGFDDVVSHVLRLRSELDVPNTLVELGVDADAVDTVAAAAVVDPTAATNPITVDHEFAAAVFAAACEGRLD